MQKRFRWFNFKFDARKKTYRQSEGYKNFCNTDELKEKRKQYRSKPEAKEKHKLDN